MNCGQAEAYSDTIQYNTIQYTRSCLCNKPSSTAADQSFDRGYMNWLVVTLVIVLNLDLESLVGEKADREE